MKKYLLLSAVAIAILMSSCRDFSYEEETNRVYIEGLTVETVAHEYFEEARTQTPVISAPAERISIDGFAEIDDINDSLEIELPSEEYETINGLVIALLGEIPEENKHPDVVLDRYKFTVLDSNEKFITKIKLEILPLLEDSEDNAEEEI